MFNRCRWGCHYDLDAHVWSPSESSSDCGKLFVEVFLWRFQLIFFLMIVQVTTVMKQTDTDLVFRTFNNNIITSY